MFYWNKDPKQRYKCNLITVNQTIYDIDRIIAALPILKLDEEKKTYDKKKYKTLLPIVGTKSSEHNNIKHIKDKNIEALHEILKPTSFKVSDNEEV